MRSHKLCLLQLINREFKSYKRISVCMSEGVCSFQKNINKIMYMKPKSESN